jgi:hypothetical protein
MELAALPGFKMRRRGSRQLRFRFFLASVHNINGYEDFYSLKYSGLDADDCFHVSERSAEKVEGESSIRWRI